MTSGAAGTGLVEWKLPLLAMHAAIGVTMGLYLFALIMVVLNVAAFGANSISIRFLKGSRLPSGELRNKADEEGSAAAV